MGSLDTPGTWLGRDKASACQRCPGIHRSSLEGELAGGTGHKSQANRKCKCLTLGFKRQGIHFKRCPS